MRRPTLRTPLLTFVLLVATAPGASAQVPIRVRGAIAKVSVKHKGGFVRVIVPNDVPIVTFAAGDKTWLRQGAHVFIPAQQQADGTVTAARVLVGKDGLIPPM